MNTAARSRTRSAARLAAVQALAGEGRAQLAAICDIDSLLLIDFELIS